MKPMRSETANRVALLFSIHRIKLFCNDGDFVAIFGEPAMASDGWIINLPAPHLFVGDYRSLPFDVDLQAGFVQAQSALKQPLASFVSLRPSEMDWEAKVAMLGIDNYELPDLFRDISSILISDDQPELAFAFIQVARELRPDGPLIRQMFDGLAEKVA
jgi:hypothetical protein